MAAFSNQMRRREHLPAGLARMRLDPGLGVAVLAALFGLWPLLSRAGLPPLTDAHHHIYRTFEILAAWREGVLYLRWAPDFYYGYGYPVFNYYAPLTYYLAAAYGLLFGAAAGIKFVLVAAALLGAAGAYLLARDQWGPAAGVAAAAAYGLSPYLMFVDPVLRGAAPEALALGLAPWTLWLGLRLARTPSPALFAATTLLLAALLLAHNLLSIVTVALMLAWVTWHLPELDRQERWRGVGAVAAALGLALGLAAFFWLPAVLERGAIQLQGAFLPGEARGLVPPAELFGPATPADAQAVQIGDFKFRLGWPQWVFGALGALTLLRRGAHRRPVLFFTLVALAAIGLMLPVAAPVWAALHPLALLQFAWRLLGVGALALAMLAGAATQWGTRLPRPLSHPHLSGAVLAACLAAALPLLNPRPWPPFGPVDGAASVDLELSGRWGVGTTHGIEFMPRAVQWLPVPQPAVVAAYRAGTVEKVDRAQLPAGVEVTPTEHGALHDAFHTAASEPFVLRLFTHDFPGWAAYIDGQRTPIRVTVPEGWLSLEVPAGEHEVHVRLEDTPPRRLGWAVSAVSALGLVAALAVGRVWPLARERPTPEPLDMRPAAVLGAMVAASLVFQFIWVDVFTPGRVPRTGVWQHETSVSFENNLVLLGYDLPQTGAPAGADLPLTLYWQATAPAPQPVSVFVHVYAADGSLWGQSDKLDPVDGLPATRWWPFDVMRAEHTISLSPDAPAGTYTLAVGLWYRPTGTRLRVLNEAGEAVGEYVVLTNDFEISQP